MIYSGNYKIVETIEEFKESLQKGKVIKLKPDSTLIPDNIRELKKIKKPLIYKKIYMGKPIKLEDIIKGEKFLEYIANEINSKNFSDFEKLIAVYDIVKKIKEYNYNQEYLFEYFNIDDWIETSSVHAILNNEYIVCRGFMNLTIDLLKRVGIKTVEKVITNQYHYLTKVYIKDDKYSIDGEYLTDATFDNKSIYRYNFLIRSIQDYKKVMPEYEIKGIKESKPISLETIIRGIINVKSKIFKNFNEEERRNFIKKIIEENKWAYGNDTVNHYFDEYAVAKLEQMEPNLKDLDYRTIRAYIRKYLQTSQINIQIDDKIVITFKYDISNIQDKYFDICNNLREKGFTNMFKGYNSLYFDFKLDMNITLKQLKNKVIPLEFLIQIALNINIKPYKEVIKCKL